MAEETATRSVRVEEMIELRGATESIARWLRADLEDRLETLRPLLAPARFLGEHLKSGRPEAVKGADQAFEKLKADFREAAGEPFRLPGKLESPVEAPSQKLDLHLWERTCKIGSGPSPKAVAIKSPLSWAILFSSHLTVSQTRQMLSGGAARSEDDLRRFATNAVLTKLVIESSPGVVRMLEALRYRVEVTTTPETGKLPLVRISSCVPTFRPDDAGILNAVSLSGVPIFEELVDLEAVRSLDDPFRKKVLDLAGAPTGAAAGAPTGAP